MVITLSILDMGGLFASGVTEEEMQRRKSAPPHAPINRFNLIRAFSSLSPVLVHFSGGLGRHSVGYML